MKIMLNGTAVQLDGAPMLADVIAQIGAPRYAAAALNGEFVPRSRHAETPLREGDEVEIVGPMQGG